MLTNSIIFSISPLRLDKLGTSPQGEALYYCFSICNVPNVVRRKGALPHFL